MHFDSSPTGHFAHPPKTWSFHPLVRLAIALLNNLGNCAYIHVQPNFTYRLRQKRKPDYYCINFVHTIH